MKRTAVYNRRFSHHWQLTEPPKSRASLGIKRRLKQTRRTNRRILRNNTAVIIWRFNRRNIYYFSAVKLRRFNHCNRRNWIAQITAVEPP